MAQRLVPMFMVATPNREYEGPRRHRETCDAARRWLDNPGVIDGVFVQVADIDAHYRRAAEEGAEIIRALEHAREADMRLYTAEDLEGHRWMFGERP